MRLFAIPSPPYPPLPEPDYGEPRGLVFDKTSHYLYATTTNGYVLGYNVATTALEKVYHPGGWLYGIDIAADDSYLLVAQSYFGIKQGAIQKIDLTNGAITNFNFDRGDSERGALDVHFAGNTRAFFSTIVDSANAAVGQIDLTTGAVTRRNDVPIANAQRLMDGNFQIQRSADRSLLYFLDPTSSAGLTFTYHPGNDSFGPGGDVSTYFDLTNAAVNRNGSLAAVRYADTVELQAGPDFHTVHSFPDIYGGVAFNATQDVLYALTTTTDEIIAYDTNTFAELSRMWVGEDLPGPLVGKLFGIGSLFASQDGRYLALLAPTAISLFDLQNPPGPRPNFTITLTASPSLGGTVGGAGVYPGAAKVSIGAWPNAGFAFVNWTENGVVISTSQLLDFQAYSDRTLVANFQALLPIAATPAISPGGGSFKKKVKLKATCATAGARILYTTDGSDPQSFSAQWPKKGWKLTGKGSHTVKAKAIVNGYIDSAIVTATFTIR